jgi:hypothetical protein
MRYPRFLCLPPTGCVPTKFLDPEEDLQPGTFVLLQRAFIKFTNTLEDVTVGN